MWWGWGIPVVIFWLAFIECTFRALTECDDICKSRIKKLEKDLSYILKQKQISKADLLTKTSTPDYSSGKMQPDLSEEYFKYRYLYLHQVAATSEIDSGIGTKKMGYEFLGLVPDAAFSWLDFPSILGQDRSQEFVGVTLDAKLLWLAFPSTLLYGCFFKMIECSGPTESSSSQVRSEGGNSAATTSSSTGMSSTWYSLSTSGSSSGQGSGDDEDPDRRRRNLPAGAPELTPEDRQQREDEAGSRQGRSQNAESLSNIELIPAAGICDPLGGIGVSIALGSATVTEFAKGTLAPTHTTMPKTFVGHIGERGLRYCCDELFIGPPLRDCQLCGGTVCTLCEEWHADARCI